MCLFGIQIRRHQFLKEPRMVQKVRDRVDQVGAHTNMQVRSLQCSFKVCLFNLCSITQLEKSKYLQDTHGNAVRRGNRHHLYVLKAQSARVLFCHTALKHYDQMLHSKEGSPPKDQPGNQKWLSGSTYLLIRQSLWLFPSQLTERGLSVGKLEDPVGILTAQKKSVSEEATGPVGCPARQVNLRPHFHGALTA